MKVMSAVLVVLFLVTGLVFAQQKGKICVASKEKSPEAAVSNLAALAPYFLIFDEKGNLVEMIDNPFKNETGKAGRLIRPFLAEKGVTAVIGRDYCGDIVDILKKDGVSPYNFQGSAAEAAAEVAQGKVAEATKEGAAVANHKAAQEKAGM